MDLLPGSSEPSKAAQVGAFVHVPLRVLPWCAKEGVRTLPSSSQGACDEDQPGRE